jgi:hypothetical protein
MLSGKQEASMQKSVTIAALAHDLVRKRSLVTLLWDGEPEKAVSLPVPFGCSLDRLQIEAEAALRDLSAETAMVKINTIDET